MLLFTLLAIGCFLAAAALDAVEAYYVRSIGDLNGHRAGMYSMGMYVIGIFGFVSVLEYSWWLMVPECLGLYAGSRLAVRRLRAVDKVGD